MAGASWPEGAYKPGPWLELPGQGLFPASWNEGGSLDSCSMERR